MTNPTVSLRCITAPGLVLEPLTAAHAAQMFVVLSDPAIYEYENAPPQSVQGLREHYAELETRVSPNGRERWFNWVIRLPTSQLIGYVQATVYPDGRAAIAYELNSAWWGRGLARLAVQAMIDELADQHGVRRLSAVLKRENQRSMRLLQRLGFVLASPAEHAQREVERDEYLMQRSIEPARARDASQ
jgi:RimJ/RimL family protein N-acetyltransferase